ncbi:hypothetical protein D3C72_1901820 [compost metagenome]
MDIFRRQLAEVRLVGCLVGRAHGPQHNGAAVLLDAFLQRFRIGLDGQPRARRRRLDGDAGIERDDACRARQQGIDIEFGDLGNVADQA